MYHLIYSLNDALSGRYHCKASSFSGRGGMHIAHTPTKPRHLKIPNHIKPFHMPDKTPDPNSPASETIDTQWARGSRFVLCVEGKLI